jgi:hypothetical protein
MRFNIRSLLILVVYVAVGCAAMVKSTQAWASAVVTLTVATLLAAAVISVTSRGRSRAFGRGFALAGLGYLAIAYAPGAAENIGPHLATTKALVWSVKKIHGDDADQSYVAFSPDGKLLATAQGRSTIRVWDLASGTFLPPVQTPSESFIRTGQCLWALVIGCLGGLLGQSCYARSERREHSENRLAPMDSRVA